MAADYEHDRCASGRFMHIMCMLLLSTWCGLTHVSILLNCDNRSSVEYPNSSTLHHFNAGEVSCCSFQQPKTGQLCPSANANNWSYKDRLPECMHVYLQNSKVKNVPKYFHREPAGSTCDPIDNDGRYEQHASFYTPTASQRDMSCQSNKNQNFTLLPSMYDADVDLSLCQMSDVPAQLQQSQQRLSLTTYGVRLFPLSLAVG